MLLSFSCNGRREPQRSAWSWIHVTQSVCVPRSFRTRWCCGSFCTSLTSSCPGCASPAPALCALGSEAPWLARSALWADSHCACLGGRDVCSAACSSSSVLCCPCCGPPRRRGLGLRGAQPPGSWDGLSPGWPACFSRPCSLRQEPPSCPCPAAGPDDAAASGTAGAPEAPATACDAAPNLLEHVLVPQDSGCPSAS